MQHFGSQDWQAVRIREWLLLLLRFAITHNDKDEAAAWPWPTKSTRSGNNGGRWRRTSFAARAANSARRSSRSRIHIEQLSSRNTSRASTIHDCGEPFKLWSASSENRGLSLPRTNGKISGRALADGVFLGSFAGDESPKLSKFAIWRPRSYHAGRVLLASLGSRISARRAYSAVQSHPFRRNRQ